MYATKPAIDQQLFMFAEYVKVGSTELKAFSRSKKLSDLLSTCQLPTTLRG